MRGALLWGKLPAHGDFVARGIDAATRDDLDQWLSASIGEARATLNGAFEDIYDEAPPWRFAWRENDGWTAGAMAPSVDGVGRRYPLLIALTGLDGERVERTTEMLEELLYDALGGGWNADRLHAATAATAPTAAAAAWTVGEAWWTLGAERFNDALLAGARPPSLMTAMLTRAGQAAGAGEREDA